MASFVVDFVSRFSDDVVGFVVSCVFELSFEQEAIPIAKARRKNSAFFMSILSLVVYFGILNILFQRMPPFSLSLESHTRMGLPTIWFSGT